MTKSTEFNLTLEYQNQCILCGSENLEQLNLKERMGFEVGYVRCNYCTLVFANPYMCDQTIHAFYKSHYAKLYPSHNLSNSKKNKLIRNIRRLSEIMSDNTTILDYGCGDAQILDSLEDCFLERYGVDYIDQPITTSNGSKIVSHLHLDQLPSQVDLILMSQVLEHLQNPLETVVDVCQRLKHGGVLIVEVPGLYSFSSVRSAQNFKNQFKLCHKTYFTSQTLSMMIEKAGLKVVYSDQTSRVIAVKTRNAISSKEYQKNDIVTSGIGLKQPPSIEMFFFKSLLISKSLWYRVLFGILPKRILKKVIWR